MILLNEKAFEYVPQGCFKVVVTNEYNNYLSHYPGNEDYVYVAVKSEVDWAVYVLPIRPTLTSKHLSALLDGESPYRLIVDVVMRSGDKITTEELIRTIVPCTDEVFAKYRK